VHKGNARFEYTYDPFHRRLSKTTYTNGKLSDILYFLWDGKNEIGSVTKEGKIKELRVLGDGRGAEIGAAILYELI